MTNVQHELNEINGSALHVGTVKFKLNFETLNNGVISKMSILWDQIFCLQYAYMEIELLEQWLY